VPSVPRVEHVSFRFQGAGCYQAVVDRSAGNSMGSKSSYRRQILSCLQRYDCKRRCASEPTSWKCSVVMSAIADFVNWVVPFRVKSGRAVVYLHRRRNGGCPCLDSDFGLFRFPRLRHFSLRAKGRGSRRQARTHNDDGQAAVHPRLRNAWLWSGVWIGNHCCRFLKPQL